MDISQLSSVYKIPVSAISGGYADVYTNPTLDGDMLFLSTQTNYDKDKNPVYSAGGDILAISRSRGVVVYHRLPIERKAEA